MADPNPRGAPHQLQRPRAVLGRRARRARLRARGAHKVGVPCALAALGPACASAVAVHARKLDARKLRRSGLSQKIDEAVAVASTDEQRGVGVDPSQLPVVCHLHAGLFRHALLLSHEDAIGGAGHVRSLRRAAAVLEVHAEEGRSAVVVGRCDQRFAATAVRTRQPGDGGQPGARDRRQIAGSREGPFLLGRGSRVPLRLMLVVDLLLMRHGSILLEEARESQGRSQDGQHGEPALSGGEDERRGAAPSAEVAAKFDGG